MVTLLSQGAWRTYRAPPSQHWSLFPMVLLQHTRTIEIKEWVSSYETHPNKFYQEKEPTPYSTSKSWEQIKDMIVNSTVNNKQLNTLSLALCMKIKTLSLRDRKLISVSFWAH